MTSDDLSRYEKLKAAGWTARDERFSTTGRLEVLGRLRDPVSGATLPLATAWTLHLSRSAAPAAPSPMPAPGVATTAAPPSLGQLIRSTQQLALPVAAAPAKAPKPAPIPGARKPPWEARTPRTPAPEFQTEDLSTRIDRLVEQLDQLCEQAGVSGVVVLELRENTEGTIDIETTQLGKRVRTEFVQRTLREAGEE